jgi:hypothetical protein
VFKIATNSEDKLQECAQNWIPGRKKNSILCWLYAWSCMGTFCVQASMWIKIRSCCSPSFPYKSVTSHFVCPCLVVKDCSLKCAFYNCVAVDFVNFMWEEEGDDDDDKEVAEEEEEEPIYLPCLLVSNKTRGDVKDHVKRRKRRRSYRYLFSLSVCLTAIEHAGMSKIMWGEEEDEEAISIFLVCLFVSKKTCRDVKDWQLQTHMGVGCFRLNPKSYNKIPKP